MGRQGKITVFIAHHDELLAAGMTAVLSDQREFELVGHEPLRNPSNARQAAPPAGVIVADYDDAMRWMDSERRGGRVLVVTRVDREVQIRAALERGVRGYLLTPCTQQEFVTAVRDVGRGKTVLAPAVAIRIAESLVYQTLTNRELVVLHALVEGHSNKAIARQLAVTEGTVKTHVKAICAKLGAKGRLEAAAIGWRRGLVCEPRASAASGAGVACFKPADAAMEPHSGSGSHCPGRQHDRPGGLRNDLHGKKAQPTELVVEAANAA